MKPLLLILALAVSVSAQDWKPIKEMSGELSRHKGVTIETYAAEIARGDDVIKLLVRTDFPKGAPRFQDATYPRGVDPTSVSRTVSKIELNCATLVIKFVKGSGEVYTTDGKKFKSKEAPINIDAGHIFSQYFCERGEKATVAPTLKP